MIQALSAIQKSLGEINASLAALRTITEGTKAKVDDLVRWKHLILGGAITLGFVLGLAVAVVKLL